MSRNSTTVLIRFTEESGRPSDVQMVVSTGNDPPNNERSLTEPFASALEIAETIRNPNTGQPWSLQNATEVIASGLCQADTSSSVGDFLGALLFPGRLATEFGNLLAGLNRNDGLRLLVEAKPSELASLPWELARHTGQALWRRSDVAAARLLPAGVALCGASIRPWRDLRLPLHLLIVVGSDKAEGAPIRVDEEVLAVLTAANRCGAAVEIALLQQGSNEIVRQTVKDFRPDIIHFIGHGRPEAPGFPQPHLLMHDHANQTWRLTADTAAALFGQFPPRLVVLNSCGGSVSPHQSNGHPRRPTLSEALIAQAGAAAVIGMQGDVSGGVALAFARAFYRHVFENLRSGRITSIGEAVRETRNHLAVAYPNQASSWGIQTLHLHSPLCMDGRNQSHDDAGRGGGAISCAHCDSASRMVDRWRIRRRLWSQILESEQAAPRLTIIHGAASVGKSVLVHRTMQVFALRGHQVLHVAVNPRPFIHPAGTNAGGPPRNFADVMKAVATSDDGHVSGASQAALSAAFRPFLWTLYHLGMKEVPPVSLPDGDPPDSAQFFEGADANAVKMLVESFTGGVRAASRVKPVLIVLDQLEHLASMMPDQLWPNVVAPLVRDDARNINVMLVMNDSMYHDARLWRPQLKFFDERVDAFEDCTDTDVIRQSLALIAENNKDERFIIEFTDWMCQRINGGIRVSASELRTIEEFGRMCM